jgi:hypothetical protein
MAVPAEAPIFAEEVEFSHREMMAMVNENTGEPGRRIAYITGLCIQAQFERLGIYEHNQSERF